jgi:hypothetical protein
MVETMTFRIIFKWVKHSTTNKIDIWQKPNSECWFLEGKNSIDAVDNLLKKIGPSGKHFSWPNSKRISPNTVECSHNDIGDIIHYKVIPDNKGPK